MLNSDMKESQTGQVEIKDFDSTVIRLLVKYFYSGEIPDDDECSLDFLKAADIFGEDKLRDAIEGKVQGTIDIGNIMEIMTTSFIYNMPTLKKAALAFVCNNMKTVKTLDEWRTLHENHPQVLRDVMEMAFG